jgi:hypothetical protein
MGVSEIGRETTQINEVTAEEFNTMALSLFIFEIGRGLNERLRAGKKKTTYVILGCGESNPGDRATLHCLEERILDVHHVRFNGEFIY